jgi:hypothetical protein
MKAFTSLALGISTLVAASAFAAPPAPALPTGACAGILKKSTLQTFTASETQAMSGDYLGAPVISVYLDFDNGLSYLGGINETAAEASGDEDFTSVEPFILPAPGVITARVSTTHPYAIEASIDYVDNAGEASQTNNLLIPSNGGTTFFIQGLDNLYAGVCQQI